MQERLDKLKNEIKEALKVVKNSDSLKDLELKYLSRKGEFNQILKSIASLAEEEKKKIGSLANEVKKDLMDEFSKIKNSFDNEEKIVFVDVTMPGTKFSKGHLNPITLIQNDLENLFTSMGFMVLDGPELESDYYCFEALNIPKNHPARDMQDTFYIDKKNTKGEFDLVMRPHTSPVQVRAMQKYGAPLRCVAPGRVFRSEALDACHEHTFYQMEGLMIDENISMANLISVMKELINGIFKREVKTRIRPGYFPFVEPGIELDIECTICGGVGCASCKHSGWLELLPAGMVHPRVLEHGGIDTDKYSGFAFGLGLTRLAMMKYGISDIRHFNGADLRFLSQF